MKTFLMLFLLISGEEVFSQVEKFQLKGSLGIVTAKKKSIDYTLSFEEKDGLLNGNYDDTFYGQKLPLKGIASGTRGRIMIVTLPQETHGVRTISFLSSDLKGTKGSAMIPVSVVLRDDKGAPVRTAQVEGNLIAIPYSSTSLVAQKQEASPCQEGFGSMAGLCGVYDGMITEEVDNDKKCNLLSFNQTHLVLDDNAEIGLYLGEVSEIISTPLHRIGRLPAGPENTNVDLLSRSCRPLPGTTFKGDDCKRLALIGSFSVNDKTRHFAGTYTMVDENTNQSCRYSLSMDQKI